MSKLYRGEKSGRDFVVWVEQGKERWKLPEVMFFGPFATNGPEWGVWLTAGCINLAADLITDATDTRAVDVGHVILVAEELLGDLQPHGWELTQEQVSAAYARARNNPIDEAVYTREE